MGARLPESAEVKRELLALIWLALGEGGGSGGLGGPWTTVTHAQSPFTAASGELKFLVDSTAGPVTIDLAALPAEAIVLVKDWKGTAGINPITVVPPAGGTTIEDPSNPGHQGASGTLNSQGQIAGWQNVTTLAPPQLVQIIS